jgi:hypothetical protein
MNWSLSKSSDGYSVGWECMRLMLKSSNSLAKIAVTIFKVSVTDRKVAVEHLGLGRKEN